jgi:glycosyltransferase involved in cell wall biosynthesis
MSAGARRPTRIALVAPYGYPALAGLAGRAIAGFAYVGGAEMQQARLARVLAARGHDVWMVSADFGQVEGESIEGVRVARAVAPFGGLPGLRFFHPRWSGVARALDRVAPDIVYQRTAGPLTGQCALWAGAHGRRFVFACAHDFDTWKRSPVLTNPRDRFFYRLGLHRADRVLAQTTAQAEALRTHHGIAAAVVRNLVPLPAPPRDPKAADRVVWLGTVKDEKRPGWIVDAARALPDVGFTLAGGPPPLPASDACYHELLASARTLPNLEATGFVPPADVPALLARAALFTHTSEAEGFPNTLLEAWACGVPSVSVVDPDGAAARGGGGLVVGDVATFVEAVRALAHDPARREAMGARARAHVAAEHAEGPVAEAFERAVGIDPARTAGVPGQPGRHGPAAA